ncbi:MAG: hypothetical protein QXG00_02915 [Candidatus Woesearchaeota archaeon]
MKIVQKKIEEEKLLKFIKWYNGRKIKKENRDIIHMRMLLDKR